MDLKEMGNAIRDAKATLDNSDAIVTDMARIVSGRLRVVQSNLLLTALKNELKDFNISTGEWKEMK